MKIVLKTTGIIAIMVIIGLSMVTCSIDPCKDGHTFPDWTNPSCTVAGNSERTCINCTETDTRTSGFAALGHQGLTPAFAATCTVVGNNEASGTCTRAGCGQVITGTIIPAGHQGLTPAFAATCTVAGNSEASGTCTRTGCGQIFTGTVIPALGHQGLIPAFAATCTVAGNSEISGTCTRAGCGQVFTGTIIPAGHNWNWVVTTPPNFGTSTAGVETKTCTVCADTDGTRVYPILALGATGPAGGKIIYRAPSGFTVTSTTTAFTTYTAYYLEAAPANAVGGTGAQTTMRWSTSWPYPDVTGTGLGIGSGRNNTALIIAVEKAAYPSDTYIYAALACDNYSASGYNDWFLPSRDELNQLYSRRTDVGIASGLFWSSSQFSSNIAWHQRFLDGNRDTLGKINDSDVRPVRAF